MPKLKSISPLWLTDDLDRTIEYYESILGFRSVERNENHYAEVSRDGVSIRLIKANSFGAINSISACEKNGFAEVYIVVDDVLVLFDETKSRGAMLDGDPQDSGYGMIDFIVTDRRAEWKIFSSSYTPKFGTEEFKKQISIAHAALRNGAEALPITTSQNFLR